MARKSRKHLQNNSDEQITPIVENPYMAGIYARTSSREQKGNSIENQRYIAENYIKDNPDIELVKIYVDCGVSSFDRVRPGFEEMLLDIESKSINCVIVKDISRFTRDDLEAGDYLQRKFPLWGIRFISIGDNFDSLRDDATQLGVALRSLFSYQYSIALSKNIQSVIAAKQKAGTYIPAKLPYGYKKARTKYGIEWKPDEQTAPIVRQIFKDAAFGLSAFAIASKLNKQKIPAPSSKFWSSGSTIRILRNMSYTGTLVTRKTQNNIAFERKTIRLSPEAWIKHHGHHVPIVDEITFYTVQRILSGRRSFITQQVQTEDFFCGKLYCGICGRKMRSKRSANGNIYYICPQRDWATSSCPNKARNELKLKKLVSAALTDRIDDLRSCYQDAIAYEKSPYFQLRTANQDKMIQTYEKEIDRLFQSFQRLVEESVINNTSRSADIQGLLRHLMRTRATLQKRLADVVQARDEYQENESPNSKKFQPFHMFRDCTELTPQMLEEMVERVFVDIGGVRVVNKQ